MICVFKCKFCGDRMRYSLDRHALVCSTCESVCEVEDYDISTLSYEGTVISEDGVDMLSCPNCGSNVIVGEGSAKLKCTYCNSEMAAFGVRDNEVSPEKIIPCKLSEDEARGKLITWWLAHKHSMPKLDMEALHMTLQDIYVPVWLYDSHAITSMVVEYAPYQPEGFNIPNQLINKRYSSVFKHVPFDASCHIYDNQFHNIEPYDYRDMVPYNPAYLSGHQAERYHFTPDETLSRVMSRMKKFAEQQTKEFIDISIHGGTIVETKYAHANIIPENVEYVLVPMWIANYEYKGEKKNIYINGQTGKTDGDVLIDQDRFSKNIALYSVSALWASVAGGIWFGEMALVSRTFMGPMLLFGIFVALTFFLFFRNIFDTIPNKSEDAFRLSNLDKLNLRHKGGLGLKPRMAINIIIAAILSTFAYLNRFTITPVTMDRNGFYYVGFIVCGLVFAFLMIMSFYSKRTEVEEFRQKSDYLTYIKMTEVFEIKNFNENTT